MTEAQENKIFSFVLIMFIIVWHVCLYITVLPSLDPLNNTLINANNQSDIFDSFNFTEDVKQWMIEQNIKTDIDEYFKNFENLKFLILQQCQKNKL